MMAWRKSTLANLRDGLMWPAIATVVTLGAMVALKIGLWSSGLCFGLCAWVTTTVVQEYWRGGNVRRKNTGTDMFTAIIGLVGRNKRRYGGYIVHLGIVLIFMGFAGNGSKKDNQVLLKPGEKATIGRYTLRQDSLKVSDDGQKQMVTAYLTVFVDGQEVDRLYPAKWAFRKHEQEPTTEVAIRRTLAEDLYVVLGGYDPGAQSATLQLVVNPLVNWIWLGFGILAFGTGITLLPERTYSFALAKLPEAAAGTTVALIFVASLFGGATLSAQMSGSSEMQTSYYARTPFETQMQHEIVCTCGCGHTTIAECRKDPCGTSHKMRGEVASPHRSGQVARRDHSVVRHKLRQRRDAGGPDRQRVQPPGLAVSVPDGRGWHRGHRARSHEVVATPCDGTGSGRSRGPRPRRTSRR